MNKDSLSHKLLSRFGFSYERGGAHTSRTMMLAELRQLFAYVDNPDASKETYFEAINTANCLSKRSGKTRVLTYRHLVDLYSLDPNLATFRALRFFWKRDIGGQPLMAALSTYSRDPIFRASASFICGFPEGGTVTRNSIEDLVDHQEPGRFSKATLKSTAQNINSSWTQAGCLTGRAKKIRIRAEPTSGAVSLALFLGYLKGLRGESLLNSEFTRLLDCSSEKVLELAEDASRKGWISLKRVGRVVEVLFPGLINAQEMEWLREQN